MPINTLDFELARRSAPSAAAGLALGGGRAAEKQALPSGCSQCWKQLITDRQRTWSSWPVVAPAGANICGNVLSSPWRKKFSSRFWRSAFLILRRYQQRYESSLIFAAPMWTRSNNASANYRYGLPERLSSISPRVDWRETVGVVVSATVVAGMDLAQFDYTLQKS
jgi:hypothetical protein